MASGSCHHPADRTRWCPAADGPSRRAGDVRVLLRPGMRCCCRFTPHRGSRRERHSRFRTDPGEAAANARLLLHDGLRGAEQAGDAAADPRVHKQIRGVRPDGVPYDALEPRPTPGSTPPSPPGSSRPTSASACACSESGREQLWAEGHRLDACSGSVIATCRPRGWRFASTSTDHRAHSPAHGGRRGSARRVRPPGATGALARLPPAVVIRVQAAQPRHLAGHRRLLPAGLRTASASAGAGAGARAASPGRRPTARHARDARLPAEYRAGLPGVAPPGARAGEVASAQLA